MTVADYFATHRDEHGRAWLSQQCWIEHGVGCFRLNTPTGEVSLVGSDDVGVAESIAAEVFSLPVDEETDEEQTVVGGVDSALDDDTGEDSSVALQEGTSIDFGEDDVADHFDDFRGRGAWPGKGADDAEPEDFEESVSDINWDYDRDPDQE